MEQEMLQKRLGIRAYSNHGFGPVAGLLYSRIAGIGRRPHAAASSGGHDDGGVQDLHALPLSMLTAQAPFAPA